MSTENAENNNTGKTNELIEVNFDTSRTEEIVAVVKDIVPDPKKTGETDEDMKMESHDKDAMEPVSDKADDPKESPVVVPSSSKKRKSSELNENEEKDDKGNTETEEKGEESKKVCQENVASSKDKHEEEKVNETKEPEGEELIVSDAKEDANSTENNEKSSDKTKETNETSTEVNSEPNDQKDAEIKDKNIDKAEIVGNDENYACILNHAQVKKMKLNNLENASKTAMNEDTTDKSEEKVDGEITCSN